MQSSPNDVDAPQKHDPYLAFRYPTYRLYIGGWVIAMFGTRIQSIAIAWEMYQRTGEALSLGLVGLVQALPTMLLALPAGYLADSMNRRTLVMISLGAMTLTSLALALLSISQGPVLWMYLLLFLDATVVTLGRPARTALVPRLVPESVFPNAVTWNTSLMQIASVAGPALGGLIIAAFSPATALFLSAFSSLVFILLLSRVKLAPMTRKPDRATLETLLGGIRFVLDKRLVLALMSLDMFAVLLGGAVYLLPIFAEDILQVGATGFGWLEAAPAAGALCMALTLAHFPPMKRAGRNLLLAIAGFGVATIIFGLSTSFWLSMLMLFFTGALDNISMVIRHTLVQLLTPDHMRGRVSAVNQVFVGASNEIGGFESGVVAHYFGPIVSVVSGGIGTIGVVIVTAIIAPELRKFGALTDAVEAAENAKK
ncbi:MAG: MFS transporter [Chloroflexota bacterium]